jgi:hypothetical protein
MNGLFAVNETARLVFGVLNCFQHDPGAVNFESLLPLEKGVLRSFRCVAMALTGRNAAASIRAAGYGS